MRALLSAVGTRGDVQPIVALALAVRALGHDVRLAVPPNFVAWAHGFGLEAAPVGVEMRAPAKGAAPLTEEQLRALRASMPDLITDQFEKVGAAAEGCDVILGANAHQYAARSIAERRAVPYVTALDAPVALPSRELAPPPLPGQAWELGTPASNDARWTAERAAWNARALERVNHNRARLGLAPIDDVLGWNVTDQPWLATDAALGPAPESVAGKVFQTGAWILANDATLSGEVASFLAGGAAPIHLGFGSMPAPSGAGAALVLAVRAAGHRAILSRGWAELEATASDDVLVVDEVDQRALFPRVAAVVHHGGAGTTAAAARAGVPQLVVPMFGDQHYWAHRVRTLGLGHAMPAASVTDASALATSLREALAPSVAEQARAFALQLSDEGAAIAARALVARSLHQDEPGR